MAQKRANESTTSGRIVIQLSLPGLVVFGGSLMVAAALLTYGLVVTRSKGDADNPRAPSGQTRPSLVAESPQAEMPPWGELVTHDIELEMPEEYAAFEINTNQAAVWSFAGKTAEQVRTLMLSCGLATSQIEHALSPQLALVTPPNTVVKPDDELVLSLSPQTRAELYRELAHNPANNLIRYPFCLPSRSLGTWLRNLNVSDAVATTIKQLMYPRGDTVCFSDYEVLLRHVPSESQRLDLIKAFSRQPAVLLRLLIRQSTDIDKVIGYWDKGMQVKNVRPLLESLKRLEDGGSISCLYLLPHFVRERLYTFPLPTKAGDPTMDCHWSTMNFFNETPDNRFADPNYTGPYLGANYYQVAKATVYGDLIFIVDEHDSAIHSAVYLADDIVFTKNGNNFTQPWKLMRMKDLLALYAPEPSEHTIVYRNRNW